MAVAADSHRDFLIPERTVPQYARQWSISIPMRCVYSFVCLYYNTPAPKKQDVPLKNTASISLKMLTVLNYSLFAAGMYESNVSIVCPVFKA